jgi:hypothetical protein
VVTWEARMVTRFASHRAMGQWPVPGNTGYLRWKLFSGRTAALAGCP